MSLSPVMAVRVAGLVAGVCLVTVVALSAWRVPASARPAAVALDLRVVATGEVGVAPAGAVFDRSGAAPAPGGPAVRGRLRLSNRTAGALRVRARVTGGDAVLDRVVEVSLRSGGREVYRGPLGGLADAGPLLSLPRAGGASLDLSARIPGSAAPEAAARGGRWTLTFWGAR